MAQVDFIHYTTSLKPVPKTACCVSWQRNYGVGVRLAAGTSVFADVAPAVPPDRIDTYTSSPKYCPAAVDIRQLPRIDPLLTGAVISTEISVTALAATLCVNVYDSPLIASPPVKANL